MAKKYSIQIGPQEKEILTMIGKGLFLSMGLAAIIALPGLPAVLAPFIKNSNQKSSFKRSLKRLEEKKLIYLSGEKIEISKNGTEMLEYLKAADIEINRTKWDKTWRIISYDIPDKFKTKRDYFRRKLINLGFKNIQKSMWVIPYECKKEIAIFAQSLGLSPFVLIMTTDYLPRQKELIKHFKI